MFLDSDKMMKITYLTEIWKDSEKNATGIQVPGEVVEKLGSGKRPPVKVTLNGYTYRTTMAVMGGVFMLPLSAENRTASGVKAGDHLEITLELDTEPRTVEVPADLRSALLNKSGASSKFDALSFSVRKEYVRQVESAKARETRDRRIAIIVEKLGGS